MFISSKVVIFDETIIPQNVKAYLNATYVNAGLEVTKKYDVIKTKKPWKEEYFYVFLPYFEVKVPFSKIIKDKKINITLGYDLSLDYYLKDLSIKNFEN
jgi:hypothetical protein